MNKEYDLLLSCGDSFTAGMEILGDQNVSEENKTQAYPMHLADMFRIPNVSNTALSGATNEFIARQTMTDILKVEKEGQDLSRVFVIVGWSSINRLEIYVKDQLELLVKQGYLIDRLPSPEMGYFGTNFINPTIEKRLVGEDGVTEIFNFGQKGVDFCNEYIWHENLEYEKWFSNIVLLKGFLESKGIKFLFHLNVHVWDSRNTERVKKYDSIVDDKRFFKFKEFTFQQWGNREWPFLRRAEGHFQKLVHVKFAEMIKEYIDNEKLMD